MKIMTLNIWGGRVGEPLDHFFAKHSDVDILLLQEVFLHATAKTNWDEKCRPDIFQEIADLLPDHAAFFAPSVVNEWGLAAYVKRSIAVDGVGDIFVHRSMDSLIDLDGSSIGRNLQWIKLSVDGNAPMFVLNFHGLWTGKDKNDTEERLQQSARIIEFIKTLHGRIVLCGDFNLNPDTKSLEMLTRGLALRNLITEYGVTSTRTSFYTKPEKFADYILVSPDVQVRRFEVLSDAVSDHAPLYLEV